MAYSVCRHDYSEFSTYELVCEQCGGKELEHAQEGMMSEELERYMGRSVDERIQEIRLSNYAKRAAAREELATLRGQLEAERARREATEAAYKEMTDDCIRVRQLLYDCLWLIRPSQHSCGMTRARWELLEQVETVLGEPVTPRGKVIE